MSDDDFGGYGKAAFDGTGGTKVYAKRAKLVSPKGDESTSFICRILPPIKSQIDNPQGWARYHGEHWGYSGVNQKDPSKTSQRPFRCIEQMNWKTKMIQVECRACSKIKEIKEEKERREAEGMANGKTEEQVALLVEPLEKFLRTYNTDRKFWMNVMTPDGEFHVLSIGSKLLKNHLKPLLEKVAKEEGIDPLSPREGVWLNFERRGQKINVSDTVVTVKDSVEVPGVGRAQITKKAPMTPEQWKKALEICPDLEKGVVKAISQSQIDQIVSCSGDPEEIDSIWAQGTYETSPRARYSPAPVATSVVAVNTPAPVVAPVVKAAPAVVSAAAAVPEVDDEEAALEAALAAAKAKKAAKAKAEASKAATQAILNDTPLPKAPAPVKVAATEEMSDEDFLNQFNS